MDRICRYMCGLQALVYFIRGTTLNLKYKLLKMALLGGTIARSTVGGICRVKKYDEIERFDIDQVAGLMRMIGAVLKVSEN